MVVSVGKIIYSTMVQLVQLMPLVQILQEATSVIVDLDITVTVSTAKM